MRYPILHWLPLTLSYGLSVALFFALFRTRLSSRFPAYVGYLGWRFFRAPVAMFVGARYGYRTNAYGIVYWVMSSIGWILFFLVILELYENALHGFPGLRRFFRVTVVCGATATVLLIAASLIAGAIVELHPNQWVNTWMYEMQRSMRVAHAGLLASLALFLRCFRLPVSRWLWALTLLLLANSSVEFTVSALRSQLGPSIDAIWAPAMEWFAVGYNLSLLCAAWKWGREEEPQPVFVVVTEDHRQALLNRLETIMSAVAR